MTGQELQRTYGDDFALYRIDLKKMVEEMVGLEKIPASHDIDIVDDHDEEWVDDQSKPEVEIDDEQQYEQELKNLRVGDQCHDSGRRPREQEIHKR